MKSPKTGGGLGLALANPQFRLYTFGGMWSLIGTWIQRIAIAWLAWQVTESYTWVSAMAMADMLPVVFIAPVAGALADRLDRLPICRVLQYAHMVQAVTLAVLAFSGLISIWLLFALTLVAGILNATFQPFRQSVIANIVSREELPGAIAINSGTWHGARFVGPMIAAGIIAGWGTSAAFAINAITYIPFIYALYRLQVPKVPPTGRSLSEVPREVIEGVRYAFTHPVIAPILFILFVSSCVGRAVLELLPGFAAQVYGRGEGGYGILVSAAGLGAMVGAFWFGWKVHFSILVRVVTVNVLLLGIALVALVSNDRFELGIVSLAAAGFGVLVSGISIQTIVQTMVDESIRGRVMGVFGWFWVGIPGLGAILLGAISDITGPRWPVFGGAVLVLLVWVWALRHQRGIDAKMQETLPGLRPDAAP